MMDVSMIFNNVEHTRCGISGGGGSACPEPLEDAVVEDSDDGQRHDKLPYEGEHDVQLAAEHRRPALGAVDTVNVQHHVVDDSEVGVQRDRQRGAGRQHGHDDNGADGG